MFCPKCKTESRAGVSTCSGCGADLVSSQPVSPAANPESHSEPIVLRTCANRVEAEVAAAALDSVGIEAIVRSHDGGRKTAAFSPAPTAQLLVRPEDVDAANDFLDVEGIGKESSK